MAQVKFTRYTSIKRVFLFINKLPHIIQITKLCLLKIVVIDRFIQFIHL